MMTYKFKAPNTLIFFVTNDCNLHCKHCFYWGELGKRKSEELKIREIKKISNNWGAMENLLIGGGEPFVRSDLPKICEMFAEKNDVKLIHIPTNGIIKERIIKYTQKILERCVSSEVIVGVSIEGNKDNNDFIRGDGSFEKSIGTLRELEKLKTQFKNFSLTVITTISSNNYRIMPDFFGYIQKNFAVDYHAYHPIRGNPLDKSLTTPTPQQWRVLTKKLLNFDKHYFVKKGETGLKLNLHLKGKKYAYETIAESLRGKQWPFECLAGKNIIVLEPNGQTRFCELTEKIFNIRDYEFDINKALVSEQIKEKMVETVGKSIPCKTCTHSCFMIPSLVNSPLHLIEAFTELY